MKTPEELTARYEALCHEEWAKVERGAGDRALARLVAEAVEAEREACAMVILSAHVGMDAEAALWFAGRIRARSAPPRKEPEE